MSAIPSINSINSAESTFMSTTVGASAGDWIPTDAEVVAFFIEADQFARNSLGQIMQRVKNAQKEATDLAALKDAVNNALLKATGNTEEINPWVALPKDISEKLWDMNLVVSGQKPWRAIYSRDQVVECSVPFTRSIVTALEQLRSSAQDLSNELSTTMTRANGDSTVWRTFCTSAIEDYKTTKKAIAQNL